LRISVRPVGRCIGGPSPARAIDASEILGAFTTTPAHSRAQGRGGSAKLFAVASFDRIAMRCTSETGGRVTSAEDANSPWTFSGLEEPSPNRFDL